MDGRMDWILLRKVVLLEHLAVLNKCQRYILKMHHELNKKVGSIPVDCGPVLAHAGADKRRP